MIELTILFVIVSLLMYGEIKESEATKVDPCEGGHTWSENYNTKKLECLYCRVIT